MPTRNAARTSTVQPGRRLRVLIVAHRGGGDRVKTDLSRLLALPGPSACFWVVSSVCAHILPRRVLVGGWNPKKWLCHVVSLAISSHERTWTRNGSQNDGTNMDSLLLSVVL